MSKGSLFIPSKRGLRVSIYHPDHGSWYSTRSLRHRPKTPGPLPAKSAGRWAQGPKRQAPGTIVPFLKRNMERSWRRRTLTWTLKMNNRITTIDGNDRVKGSVAEPSTRPLGWPQKTLPKLSCPTRRLQLALMLFDEGVLKTSTSPVNVGSNDEQELVVPFLKLWQSDDLFLKKRI